MFFGLGHVKGKVITTQRVTIPAFQSVETKGLTDIKEHTKRVMVMMNPLVNPMVA